MDLSSARMSETPAGRAPLGRGRTNGATAYRPTSRSSRRPRAAFLRVWGPGGVAWWPAGWAYLRPAWVEDATCRPGPLDETEHIEVRREHRT